MNHYTIAGLLICLLLPRYALAADPYAMTPEQLEKWFQSDSDEPPGWKPSDINDGNLVFLHSQPKLAPHEAVHQIVISKQSLQSGWVGMAQCYTGLEQMPAAQILYRKAGVRNLKITQSENIGQSWVEKNSVQMTNIGKQARICTLSEIKALQKLDGQRYVLKTGPYRRKFLDGYFPVHLVLNIKNHSGLKVLDYTPCDKKPCKPLYQQGDQLKYEALFEGVLRFRLYMMKDST